MSRFFINRPIVAIVISILTVIVGLVTLFQLPIAQYPKVVPPEMAMRATPRALTAFTAAFVKSCAPA